MKRTSLSVKISIAEVVERLNDDGCINVIRLLKDELGYHTLNSTIKHIILLCATSMTNDSLVKLEQKIKEKCPQHHQIQNQTLSTIKDNNNHVIFPLFQLPMDLIATTSLFLNEKDIFQFEQCCRLFYKMINDTSYLKKCYNFKQFTITRKRLNQMKQDKYNFFKYSKAKQLYLRPQLEEYVDTVISEFVPTINDFETTINKTVKMSNYDNWFTSLCKSISTLKLGCAGTSLLFAMPIDILFNPDPRESNLKGIEFDHSLKCDYDFECDDCMNKFEKKYLQCKELWEQEGLQIKLLQCVKHWQCGKTDEHAMFMNPTPRYIHARHVWMASMDVDLTGDRFLTNECNPGMKILTIKRRMNFFIKNDDLAINNSNVANRGLAIETMRLLSFLTFSNYDICNNQVVIDLLNLQNSLINLSIECEIKLDNDCGFGSAKESIENIFQKKYYYNLKNVNIILTLKDSNVSIDCFFKLLKENQKVLKHQFKQLNIAILKNIGTNQQQKLYFVLEWDERIDDKYLDKAQKQFDEMNHDDQNQKQFKAKYLLMRTQWLN